MDELDFKRVLNTALLSMSRPSIREVVASDQPFGGVDTSMDDIASIEFTGGEGGALTVKTVSGQVFRVGVNEMTRKPTLGSEWNSRDRTLVVRNERGVRYFWTGRDWSLTPARAAMFVSKDVCTRLVSELRDARGNDQTIHYITVDRLMSQVNRENGID